ncbi:hypothetical protein ACTXJ9_10960 [Brachybacterium tyrofermentans]|uniref:hypothetical protein n=1 Tax=Brachybacterium tyrofermentans TaxID=47848 RepID=UPI003FD5B527
MMHVHHSVPESETEDHCQANLCPCGPTQHVTAAPGKQPVVILTHQLITTQEKP